MPLILTGFTTYRIYSYLEVALDHLLVKSVHLFLKKLSKYASCYIIISKILKLPLANTFLCRINKKKLLATSNFRYGSNEYTDLIEKKICIFSFYLSA